MIDIEQMAYLSGHGSMDHHLLQQFIVIAQERQISRAAERLGIEQPPLSRAIRRLEERLAARLLVRKPRGVELTEAGRVFLEGAKKMLADFDQLVEATHQTERGERGRLILGVTATSALHARFHEVASCFARTYPNIVIQVEESQSGQLIEAIRKGTIDAAFLWTPPADGNDVKALCNEPLVVAVPSTSPLVRRAEGGSIRIDELNQETFLVYGRKDGFGLFAATIAACHRAGFSPRFGAETPRLSGALAMVALGMGVVLLPETMTMIRHPGIQYLSLPPEDRFTTSLGVAIPQRRGRESVEIFRSFMAALPEAP